MDRLSFGTSRSSVSTPFAVNRTVPGGTRWRSRFTRHDQTSAAPGRAAVHARALPPVHETVNSIRRSVGALARTDRLNSKSDREPFALGLVHASDAGGGVGST